MKTIILTSIDLTCRDEVKIYPILGIKFLVSKFFIIFVRFLTITVSKLRSRCSVDNVAIAVGAVAALVAWFAGAEVSMTDSVQSRLTLAVSALVAMVAIGISLYKYTDNNTEL